MALLFLALLPSPAAFTCHSTEQAVCAPSPRLCFEVVLSRDLAVLGKQTSKHAQIQVDKGGIIWLRFDWI